MSQEPEILRAAQAMRRFHKGAAIAECEIIIARFQRAGEDVAVQTWTTIRNALVLLEQEKRLIG